MLRRKAMRRAGFRPTLSRLARTKPMDRRPKPGSVAIVPQDVQDLCRLRDGGRCCRCRVSVLNVPAHLHHRLMRSRGGKHTPANLVTLCAPCHRDVHTGDTIQSEQDGWLLPSRSDPARIPVLAAYLGWRQYLDDGSVTAVAGRRWEAQA